MLGRRKETQDVYALIARKQYGKAAKQIRGLLRREPESVHLRQLLADVLARDGRRTEAVQLLGSLVEEFTRQGFVAKAIAVLKKIQRIDPDAGAELDARMMALVEQREDKRRKGGGRSPAAPATAAVIEAPTTIELEIAGTARRRVGDPGTATSELVIPQAWFETATEKRRDFHWSPLFSDFTKGELAAVIGGLELMVKNPGSIIYTEGEPGESLFVLAHGFARVYRRDDRGHNHQEAVLHEGEFFGRRSMLDGSARDTTVVAASECELLELDRETFERIVEVHPRVRTLVESVGNGAAAV